MIVICFIRWKCWRRFHWSINKYLSTSQMACARLHFHNQINPAAPAFQIQQCDYSTVIKDTRFNTDTIRILDETYVVDSCTNVTPRVTSKIGRRLHNRKNHPINLVRQRIQNYFYSNFTNRSGNPLFAVFDNISPVVTPVQELRQLVGTRGASEPFSIGHLLQLTQSILYILYYIRFITKISDEHCAAYFYVFFSFFLTLLINHIKIVPRIECILCCQEP